MLKLVLQEKDRNPMEFSISSKPLTIGRGEGNTIILKDASVSKNHAKIAHRDGKITIKDLKSKNGVIVCGEHIPVGKPFQLSPGNDIKVGIYSFTLEECDENEEFEGTVMIPLEENKLVDREGMTEEESLEKEVIPSSGESDKSMESVEKPSNLTHSGTKEEIGMETSDKAATSSEKSRNDKHVTEQGKELSEKEVIPSSDEDDTSIESVEILSDTTHSGTTEASEMVASDETVTTRGKLENGKHVTEQGKELSEKEIIPSTDEDDTSIESVEMLSGTTHSGINEKDMTRFIGAGIENFQAAKLVIIEGKDVGQEYLINKDTLAIGRTEDNDIVLEGPLVSRQHALIILHEENGITVKDAHSANGVFINGKKIEERTLAGGDKIKIGETVFRFVAKGEIFTTEKKDKLGVPLLKKVPRSVLISLIAILFIIPVLFIITNKKPEEKSEQVSIVDKKDQVIQKDDAVQTHIVKGTKYLEAQSWPEAIDELNRALAIKSGNVEARRLKEKAENELYNHDTLKTAQLYAVDGKFEQALKTLKKIPETSTYFQKVSAEYNLIQKERTEIYIASGKELLDKNELKAAINEFQLALDVNPGNEDASSLLDEANKKLLSAEQQKNQEEKPLPENEALTITDAVNMYSQGQGDKAMSLLQQIQKNSGNKEQGTVASSYSDYIAKAGMSYQKGMELYNQKDTEGAFAEWKKVLLFEKELPLKGKSWYAMKIEGFTADELYRKGLEIYKKGDIEGANKIWKQVIAMVPRHKDSLSKLENSARKLYREGYALEGINRDSAVLKWKEILDLVPPKSEYFEKAKAKLIQCNEL